MNKLTIRLTRCFTALFIALGLALPSPAAALRDLNTRESTPKRTGLEEALQSSAAGLEENAIWPSTDPLRLEHSEPIFVLAARGGFGAYVYTYDMVEAFHAMQARPELFLTGDRATVERALVGWRSLTRGRQVTQSVWVEDEETGRILTLDPSLEEGKVPWNKLPELDKGRAKTPQIVHHYSNDGKPKGRLAGWPERANDRVVPLLRSYYRGSPVLLWGQNTVRNQFPGFLDSGNGAFINLFQTPPRFPGISEPNAVHTGNTFGNALLRVIRDVRAAGPALRREILKRIQKERVVLKLGVLRDLESRHYWIYRYTSQGGSREEMAIFLDALRKEIKSRKISSAAVFTFLGDNPRLPYYPDHFYCPHSELAAFLKDQPDVSFLDRSRDKNGKPIFGSKPRREAPVLVLNLPVVSIETSRWLQGGSDFSVVSSHSSFMEAMGMAVERVGAPAVVSFPIHLEAEGDEIVEMMGRYARPQTRRITKVHFDVRSKKLSGPDRAETVDLLAAAMAEEAARAGFRDDLAKIAQGISLETGNPQDANLINRLAAGMRAVDEALGAGASVEEAVEKIAPQTANPAGVRAHQQQTASAAGLEEGDYERRLTDPLRHNDGVFTYWVHMTDGMDAALMGAMGGLLGTSLLTEPDRLRAFSASLLHRGADIEMLDTYRNQRVGYILRVPEENLAWVAPFDFVSDTTPEYVDAVLEDRERRGLLPFEQLLEAYEEYQTATEALVLGTSPSGRRVETIGILVIQEPNGSDPQGADYLVERGQERGLPIVRIQPGRRPTRRAPPAPPPDLLSQLNLPPNPTPADIAAGQERLDGIVAALEKAHWEKRYSYFPDVRPPSAGLEEMAPGAVQPWIGPQGRLGEIRSVEKDGRRVGRAVYVESPRLTWTSAWNEGDAKYPRGIMDPAWPQLEYRMGGERYRELREAGVPFEEWKERMTASGSSELVFLGSSLQSDFKRPYQFLVSGGQVVYQANAREKFPLEGTPHWVFVLEPGPPRVAAVTVSGDWLAEEWTVTGVDRGGRPSFSGTGAAGVTHAIAGVPLRLNDQDVSGLIQTSRPWYLEMLRMYRPILPNQVNWPLNRRASFSAIGRDYLGRTGHLAVEEHLTVKEFSRLAGDMGFTDLTLLGGSADARQWLAGESGAIAGVADAMSHRPGSVRVGGPLNAVLAAYARPAGLEEVFPAPVLVAPPDGQSQEAFKSFMDFRSYLNRHQDQWEFLRDTPLSDIIRKAEQADRKRIQVLDFGSSTGEGVARAFHEIVSWMEAQGYPVATDPEDSTKWQVEVIGVDRDPEMCQRARDRLEGKAPLVWEAHGSLQGSQSYAKAVVQTLNKYSAVALKNLRVEKSDFRDPELARRYPSPDLVLANLLLYHLPDAEFVPAIRRIDETWPQAWLSMLEVKAEAIRQNTPRHSRVQNSEYYFGKPELGAGLEEGEKSPFNRRDLFRLLGVGAGRAAVSVLPADQELGLNLAELDAVVELLQVYDNPRAMEPDGYGKNSLAGSRLINEREFLELKRKADAALARPGTSSALREMVAQTREEMTAKAEQELASTHPAADPSEAVLRDRLHALLVLDRQPERFEDWLRIHRFVNGLRWGAGLQGLGMDREFERVGTGRMTADEYMRQTFDRLAPNAVRAAFRQEAVRMRGLGLSVGEDQALARAELFLQKARKDLLTGKDNGAFISIESRRWASSQARAWWVEAEARIREKIREEFPERRMASVRSPSDFLASGRSPVPVEEVEAQCLLSTRTQMARYRLADLVRERARELRREGVEVSDESLKEKLAEIPEGEEALALDPREYAARVFAYRVAEPGVEPAGLLAAPFIRPAVLANLARLVARRSRGGPVDLWVHTDVGREPALYAVYWTGGGGVVRERSIFSPAERAALVSGMEWGRAVAEHAGRRYRLRFPQGVEAGHVAAFLKDADWWAARPGENGVTEIQAVPPEVIRLLSPGAGLEEGPVRAERITSEQFARIFPGERMPAGARGAYLVPGRAGSRVKIYSAHETLWGQLRQWLDGERAALPEGVEVNLLRLPADPGELKAPGVIVKDWMLKLPYGQQILPELETAVGQPLPSLPTMVLFALKGAGGQVEAVIGVMTLEDAEGNTVYAYFV